jgi:hypothetical protein
MAPDVIIILVHIVVAWCCVRCLGAVNVLICVQEVSGTLACAQIPLRFQEGLHIFKCTVSRFELAMCSFALVLLPTR